MLIYLWEMPYGLSGEFNSDISPHSHPLNSIVLDGYRSICVCEF